MFRNTSRGWLGVDIGSHSVKAAQLVRTATGFELRAAAIPRNPDPTLPPLQKRAAELSALRALEPRLRGPAAATLTMRDCQLTAIDAESEPDVASTDTPLAMDAWGDAARGYSLATPLAEIEAICDSFDRAGVRCETVDGAPTAIARALRLIPRYRPGELVVGLDWGQQSATLVAAADGEARYARQLRCEGFDDVVVRVAEQLGFPAEEAERALRKYGCETASGPGAVVGQAVRAALGRVPAELTRTVSHLEGKLKTKCPRRWVLMGAGATTPGVAAHLAERLDVSFETWTAEGVDATGLSLPLCLLAPAVALSALRWEESA